MTWNVIKGFLGSKKFVAMIAGLIVTFAAKYGLNLEPDTINQIVGLIIAYIVGQGIADNGKAAAQVEAIAEVTGGSSKDKVEAIKNV